MLVHSVKQDTAQGLSQNDRKNQSYWKLLWTIFCSTWQSYLISSLYHSLHLMNKETKDQPCEMTCWGSQRSWSLEPGFTQGAVWEWKTQQGEAACSVHPHVSGDYNSAWGRAGTQELSLNERLFSIHLALLRKYSYYEQVTKWSKQTQMIYIRY